MSEIEQNQVIDTVDETNQQVTDSSNSKTPIKPVSDTKKMCPNAPKPKRAISRLSFESLDCAKKLF